MQMKWLSGHNQVATSFMHYVLTLSHQPSHVYSKQVFNKYQPMYDNYTENLYIPRQLSIKSPIQFSWQSTEHETLHSVSTAH